MFLKMQYLANWLYAILKSFTLFWGEKNLLKDSVHLNTTGGLIYRIHKNNKKNIIIWFNLQSPPGWWDSREINHLNLSIRIFTALVILNELPLFLFDDASENMLLVSFRIFCMW